MKQFKATYLNWKDKIVVEYLIADSYQEAWDIARIRQGLKEIYSIEEVAE